MAADRARIAPEGEAARPTPRDTPPGPREEVVPAAPAATASPTSLAGLAGPPRAGRGFDAARAATLLGLQQTLGNRAVQRLVQRAASSSAPATAPAAPAQEDLAARIRGAGGGQPLAPQVQGRLEAGLGADLTGVQVHADAEADRLSRAVDATAFTSGADIFFREGAYNPSSSDGLQTLAHEATHVVQQAAGPVEGTPAPGGVAISDPGDQHEEAAARAAVSIVGPQQMVGEQAVQRLLRMGPPAPGTAVDDGPLALQRSVYKAGGKGAVAIPAEAKEVARWVMNKASVQPGGSNYIADIQGRGFPGFKKGKAEYAGGRDFNNNAQPDNNRLPYMAGQTYQEWDTEPCVAGAGRGANRIVTSSDGTVYYSNDHYANFTEFTP